MTTLNILVTRIDNRLVRGNVPINEVNVGNMHFAESKRQIHKTVSVDDDYIAAFRKLMRLGVQ